MSNLPPLHRQSRQHNLTMNDLRLPPIAALVSTAAPRESLYEHPSDPSWSPLHRPADDTTVSSSSSQLLDNKWTAINHHSPSAAARPTPTSRYVFPPAPNARPLSPLEGGRYAPSILDQHTNSSTPFALPPHFYDPAEPSLRHSSPPQFPREEPIALKPITAARQDSAVAPSPVFHASADPQGPLVFATVHATSIPSPSRSILARDVDVRPKSPCSPADTSSDHSTGHDRRRASPPDRRQYDMTASSTHRPRALSDSTVSPSSQSIQPAHSPSRLNAVESTIRGNMAPPPNPASAIPAASSSSRAGGDDSSPKVRSAASLVHRREASESNSEAITPLRALPSSDVTRALTRAVGAPYHPHLDSYVDSLNQCLNCGAVWSYPPIEQLTQGTPSETSQDMRPPTLKGDLDRMDQSADLFRKHFEQYSNNKALAYANWERHHQTKVGQPEASIPCMFPRNEATEGTLASNKRKSNVPLDDGHMSTKFRRLSCNSPPQTSQLTPPPDQPLSSSPQHLAGLHESKPRCEPPPM